jgi:hypothetical protein
MRTRDRIVAGCWLGLWLFMLAAPASGATVRRSGEVIEVNEAGDTVVVGDMGPMLANGTSAVTRRSIRVTPSTTVVRVGRAAGAAPSGWVGDYVESKLGSRNIKRGDWVTIEVDEGAGQATARKVIVVDTSQP